MASLPGLAEMTPGEFVDAASRTARTTCRRRPLSGTWVHELAVDQLAGLTLLMLKSGTRSIGIAARVNQSFHSRGSVRSVRLA
jgi:hypothetical protein